MVPVFEIIVELATSAKHENHPPGTDRMQDPRSWSLAITVYCQSCGTQMKAAARMLGRQAPCPNCQAMVQIVAGSKPPPPASPPDSPREPLSPTDRLYPSVQRYRDTGGPRTLATFWGFELTFWRMIGIGSALVVAGMII